MEIYSAKEKNREKHNRVDGHKHLPTVLFKCAWFVVVMWDSPWKYVNSAADFLSRQGPWYPPLKVQIPSTEGCWCCCCCFRTQWLGINLLAARQQKSQVFRIVKALETSEIVFDMNTDWQKWVGDWTDGWTDGQTIGVGTFPRTGFFSCASVQNLHGYPPQELLKPQRFLPTHTPSVKKCSVQR
jgi:hypothetical protein